MYKAIKDNKIIAISDTYTEFPFMIKDSVVEDTEHTVEDYDLYYYEEDKAEYLLKSEIPAPTKEEQSKKREAAYVAETDPIQTHIDRLKDGEQTPEIIAEIEALRIERDEKIAAIKERYPYPTDPITEEE
jgi:hypothetical protein